MKYAKLGQRKTIQLIIDTALQPDADITNYIELTDEQAAATVALRADRKIPIWYDGRVTTRRAEADGFIFGWDEVLGDFVKTAIIPPVPIKITAWQAKAALEMTAHPQGGTMLAAAEAVINAMPEGAQKIVVLAAWGNNANFERQSPTILSFGAALGMTSDELDALFRLGDSLTV